MFSPRLDFQLNRSNFVGVYFYQHLNGCKNNLPNRCSEEFNRDPRKILKLIIYFIIKNIETTDPVCRRGEGAMRKSRLSSRIIVDGNKTTKTFSSGVKLMTTTMPFITIRSGDGRNLAGLVPPPPPDDCR